MTSLKTLAIAGFFGVSLLWAGAGGAAAAAHGGLSCHACHLPTGGSASDPAGREFRAAGCVSCHPGYDAIFDGPMGRRDSERRFAARTWGRADAGFFDKNCISCHLRGCQDCHGSGHRIARPSVATCQNCHRGYFVGWDYSGRAPREESRRYQRGVTVNGEGFLKMLPDVHARAGMGCGACHSMMSLIGGKRSAKQCRDCHRPSPKVLEHRIAPHLERLECYACHSAWAPQEYGTFYLRFRDPKLKEDFALRPGPSPEYLKSVYLKRQDLPPLGVNARGKVAPIRPQFIAYYTDVVAARNGGALENLLLGAEWRAFFPHTVQRGTPTCEGCHDDPGRFLLEPAADRIYRLRQDGLTLVSFWDRQGQRMANGAFLEPARYARMSARNGEYIKRYLEKWQNIVRHVEASSPR